mgnify:CR=1 FL=1
MQLIHNPDVNQVVEIGAHNLVADRSRMQMPMLGAQGRLKDKSGRLRLTSVGISRDAAHAIDLQIMAIDSVSNNDNQYSELLALSVPPASNNVNADILYHPSTMAIFTPSREIEDNCLKDLIDLTAAYENSQGCYFINDINIVNGDHEYFLCCVPFLDPENNYHIPLKLHCLSATKH